MVLSPDPHKCYARIQRKLEGRRRSCAVEISAELVENLDNSAKTRKFNLTAAIEIEEVQRKKPWQKKLLPRLRGVTRMALLALFSWVLHKLTELALFGHLLKLLDWS